MRRFRGAMLAFLAGLLLVVGGTIAYAQPGPETERVTIGSGGEMDPAEVQIPAGWSIEWVNDDSDTHTLHIDFGEEQPFNVGEIRSGESVTIAFDEEGTFGFFLDGDDQDAGIVTVGDESESPTNTPQATNTTAPTNTRQPTATQEPSTVETATPEAETATPEPTPTRTGDTVASPSSTETPVPTAAPTPPPPSAGTGALFSAGGSTASLAGIFLGFAAMLLALSSVLRSASRGRISVYRVRGRRDD